MSENLRYLQTLCKLGIDAYIHKTSSSEELLATIDAASHDQGGDNVVVSMPRSLIERMGEGPVGALTERETEIVVLAARGLANHRIGEELNITEATVKRHVDSHAILSTTAPWGSIGKGARAMAWRLQGTYIENCNCDVVCPCGASGFYAPADYDRCNAVLAWHIDSGEVDGTDVGDISVVLVLDSPKQMSEGNWRVGMFMDDRASDEQAEKLGGIFSGQLGGPLANVVPLISENLGMEVAPIEHVDDGRRHRIKVGDAIDVEIEDVVSPFDPDGPAPKLTETKHPANSELTPARALAARVEGLGVAYSAEGKNGFSTPFSWEG